MSTTDTLVTRRTLLEARGLEHRFGSRHSLLPGRGRPIRAVDGVDLAVREGETFGLVGESGCGKSTLGRLLIRLLEPSAGSVHFDGVDLSSLHGPALRRMRSQMQMIFQDPFGSLDPSWRVGRIVAEPLRAQGVGPRDGLESRVAELLALVGLDESMAGRLPAAMSGGQRQRVGIARAIAAQPRFIVADEPVSALDVSVQAQVLNLLRDLQDRLGLTFVIIAHGLNVVRHVSTTVGVMYLGRLVEVGPTDEVFESFAHPYTAALMSAVLAPEHSRGRHRIILPGEVGSAARVPGGCRFHPRCPLRQPRCETDDPTLQAIGPDHAVACHFPLSSTDRASLQVASSQGSSHPSASSDVDTSGGLDNAL